MKPATRRVLRVVIGLAIALVVGLVVRAWVVPAVIGRELRARFHGPAKFDGWWLGWSSAGVTGLTLREGPGADSPAWLTADAVGHGPIDRRTAPRPARAGAGRATRAEDRPAVR